LGGEGCYLLCIVHHGEVASDRYIDPYKTYLDGVGAGWLREDCFVVNPEALMELVTGMAWTLHKEDAAYVAAPGELEVQRWEWQEVGVLHGHFVCPDWDPMGKSLTVANGRLVSKRIFTRRS